MAATRPLRLDEVWSSGNPTGIIYPGFAKVIAGWDLEIPNFQHFNYILAQMSQYLNYINVLGIGEWDLNTPYEEKSRVEWNGILWKSLKDTLNVEPGTDNTAWVSDDPNALVEAHAALIDNPHAVTKAQVGLGSVLNIDYGSSGEVANAATAANAILFDSAEKDISTTLATADNLKVPTSLAVRTFTENKIEDAPDWTSTAKAPSERAVEARINALSDKTLLPIGTVLMFNGALWADNVTLPGWYACTGANAAQGVPDLETSFVIGGATNGAVGGANSRVLTTANLAAHTHTINHDHVIETTSSDSHTHYNGTMFQASSPTHHPWGQRSNASNLMRGANQSSGTGLYEGLTTSDTHSHTLNVRAITGNSGSTGSASGFDNRPLFYTMIFIQKVT